MYAMHSAATTILFSASSPCVLFSLLIRQLSLSLLQVGLDPSGEGSATRVLRIHSALFSTSIRSTHKDKLLNMFMYKRSANFGD